MITEPMLAGTWKPTTNVVWPVLATPKLDGIRCVTLPPDRPTARCRAVSRKFLPVPNLFIRSFIESNLPPGLDGELMVNGAFHEVSSAVSTQGGEPDFSYHVFDVLGVDCSGIDRPYVDRVELLEEMSERLSAFRVTPVIPEVVRDLEELLEFEMECLAKGYEGVMIRTPSSPYKCGRSTEKEGWLLKVKRFVDDEATIIAVEELEHNTNSNEGDAFGRAKRSTAKAGQVAGDTLGSLVCRSKDGQRFNIGTGFTEALRDELWAKRNDLPGLTVKFKHQPHGAKEKPRSPVFLGIRHAND